MAEGTLVGTVTQRGEPVWYYEYQANIDDTRRYSGTVRVVIETHRNGKQHLTIDDPEAPAQTRQVNNILSEEDWDSWIDLNGESYWERADETWGQPDVAVSMNMSVAGTVEE